MKIEEIKCPKLIKLNGRTSHSVKNNEQEMGIKCIVIGDLHVKPDNILQSQKLLDDCYELITAGNVSFVVILGDILHTNETVKVQAHNVVQKFLSKLSTIKIHTFIIIGNHDYINESQFHTEEHIFTPFKQWTYVTVVDSATAVTVGKHNIVLIPYVPPGKFLDSLNTLLELNQMWEDASCIFAHQEMKDCYIARGIKSTKGDDWCDEYPPIVSGHIHTSQKVRKNIYYPGSPISHSYTDTNDKFIWIIDFDNLDKDNDGYPYFVIEKIKTETNNKICKTFDSVTELMKEDLSNNSKELTIKVNTNPDEFKSLKSTAFYKELYEKKIRIIPKYVQSHKKSKMHQSFKEILREKLAEEKELQNLFDDICSNMTQ
jgi:DNA repair exonuclease SbcCD nuclease subunit